MQLDLLGEAESDMSVDDELVQPEMALGPQIESPAKMSSATSDEPTNHATREKASGAFQTISEVANSLGVPQYVLRFWETRFSQIKPVKMRGGRRYYRPEDIEVLTTIKNLLYKQGYTIKGAKKVFSKGMPSLGTPSSVHANGAKLPDKEFNQLAVIRQELIGLRDVLKPYVY